MALRGLNAEPIRTAGFTLMELLLVLGIAGLLLAMTPALLQKAFPVLKLKAAARDLVQEIRYVQNAAIINGRSAEIRFDLQQHAYRSDLVNGGELRTLPKGLSLSQEADRFRTSPAAGEAHLVFYPDGSAKGGTLYLGNAHRRLAIHVDWLTSRIRLDEAQH